MRHISSVYRPTEPPTVKQAQAVTDVHDVAARFALGDASLAEVRAATTGKQRWLATRYTRPDDPRFGPLMALLDALIADESGAVQTKHGLFEQADLIAAEVTIERDEGRELVVFPVAYGWLTKPDPAHGIEGVRGPARSRPTSKRGPHYSSFGHRQAPEYDPREKEWWEEDD